MSLRNTTPIEQSVSVFNPLPQQNANGTGNAPQNQYTYDISKEKTLANIYSFTYLSVLYSVNGGAYKVATVSYPDGLLTAQDFVNALNSLNQAKFFVSGTNQITSYSIGSDNNSYFYSSISANANYTVNSFTGNGGYGDLGSLIYSEGYNLNGVGTVTRINTSNLFWINSIPDTTSGRLNNCGVWSASIPTPLPSTNGVCMFANIQSNTSKTVYIGFARGNGNQVQLFVNNTEILATNDGLIATSINTQLGTSSTQPTKEFWNIYPIKLVSGNNLITVCLAGNLIKDIGFQVYDNTASEIAAATSYSGLNVLFDSANFSGNMI